MNRKILTLKELANFELFTMDNTFVLQLFFKDVNPNDIGASCVWEMEWPDVEELFEKAIDYCKNYIN